MMSIKSSTTVVCLLLGIQISLFAQSYKSDDGLFSVNFHGTPKYSTNKMNDGSLLHIFSDDVEGVSYLVFYNDFEANALNIDNPVLLLDKAMEGVSTKGTVTDVEPIFYNEFHGKKYHATIINESGEYSTEARMILANRRLYHLMVVYLYGNTKPEDTEAFFNSFVIDQSVNKTKIAQILDKLSYSYDVDSDGDYRVDFSFTEGRGQRIFINYFQNDFEQNRMLKIWSPVSNFKGKLEDSLYMEVMNFNGRHETCNFQFIGGRNDSTMLRLFATISLDNNPKNIQDLIEHIISYADQFEEKYFRRDWW